MSDPATAPETLSVQGQDEFVALSNEDLILAVIGKSRRKITALAINSWLQDDIVDVNNNMTVVTIYVINFSLVVSEQLSLLCIK